jgi:ferredoxin-NADP reductase
MTAFRTHQARLVSASTLSEVTKHLEFEIAGMDCFGFVPGQWLSFKQAKPDGEEITRAYSIASPPREDARFSLCLNRVPDGFMSNFLCDMKAGDEIQCQGPFGDFILRPPIGDTVFIATGTGIAPFRSMLQWLFADQTRNQGRTFSLISGNRSEQDIYYHEEFRQLAAKHSNFQYLPTLSRGSTEWRGLRGYVQTHVATIAEGRTDMHAYICGLDKMVSANRDLLKSLGWDRKHIRYEKYD